MTVELAAYAPEDLGTLIVAHLLPLRADPTVLRSADIERKPGDPLPFRLVTTIPGSQSVNQGIADELVSVHTLCDKTLGAARARDECDRTHRRMLYLLTDPRIVVGSRTVAVQYIEIPPGQSPSWQFYSDNILQKVGTYRVGLPYVSA